MATIPEELKNLTVKLKANVYFDGGVVSHSLTAQNGERSTVGVIRPGKYHFTTNAPERMDIIAGVCQVTLAGETAAKTYKAGECFNVPGKSAFDIEVTTGLAEYFCQFG